MSSSSYTASLVNHRPKKATRRPFDEEMDMKAFKRLFARQHRKFFEARGIDPDAMRLGSFDSGFGRRVES